MNNANVEEQIYPEVQRTLSSGQTSIALSRPVPTPAATYIGRDSLTQGSWKTIYGAEGFQIAADSAQLPQFSTVSINPTSPWIWSSNTTDRAAVERAGSSARLASAWYSSNQVDLTVKFEDPYMHRVSLYFLDYDSQNRQQTVELRTTSSGQLLHTSAISNFQSGLFVSWNVTGDVTFRVLTGTGAPAVVSALFFDEPALGRNQHPTISDIPNQTIPYNASTGSISFQISDPETAAGRLHVSAGSSNPILVPQGNISLLGSNDTRQINITPAPNQVGSATIRVSVIDGEFTLEDSFGLTVVNQPPSISSIPDQVIDEDTSTPVLGFNVADTETASSNLTATASSSNTSLVPLSRIYFGGAGSNRTGGALSRSYFGSPSSGPLLCFDKS